ncbi:Gfo/Idh/MocA family protein [Pseudozobellia thermophila]|uniref:Predicted dehydrogenase n=1 Tax=Pseudozobellia thermophila TaxID=192903 RepID=A0A1M6F1V1_9FLAO|nr:Gfo/Idh/MocA family oxidoreductase [Pseudozobellia thermophila]SHI91589.1 Predicted dehydrogenase [Pseudozobellia thermophila]
MRYFLVFTALFFQLSKTSGQSDTQQPPLRVGVVGLVHGHVHWILENAKKSNIEIVGIAEPDRDLAERLTRRYGLSMDIVFDTLDEMVKATRPEAVNAFNSTYDHLETVRYCAPKGIHVMVEKPLAVSWAHAREMAALARKHKIHLLTNYETSWYGSNKKAYELIHDEKTIGPVRRIVFHTGHMGPVEIGCSQEFLEWLTDPVLNGGGALTDFGCYGANLSTWLMKGQTPESVTCITQQLKPGLYPKVDDDATIILKYAQTEVIIQASWNWPHHIKDMEVFGTTGFIKCKNAEKMEVMFNETDAPRSIKAEPLPKGDDDPFELLRKVVHDSYRLPPYDPSSLENAEIVVQILEAAKLSAQSGATVHWKELFPPTDN